MSYTESARRKMANISKAVTYVPDDEAAEMVDIFPSWSVGKAYAIGDRIAYDGKLYKVIQAHTSQSDWLPSVVPALYAEVAKPGQGDDPSNPIPYNGNMELFKGKYYSQDGVVYICTRDSGQPLYHPLAQLVGFYVEKV